MYGRPLTVLLVFVVSILGPIYDKFLSTNKKYKKALACLGLIFVRPLSVIAACEKKPTTNLLVITSPKVKGIMG